MYRSRDLADKVCPVPGRRVSTASPIIARLCCLIPNTGVQVSPHLAHSKTKLIGVRLGPAVPCVVTVFESKMLTQSFSANVHPATLLTT
jgi:hypothetical protein